MELISFDWTVISKRGRSRVMDGAFTRRPIQSVCFDGRRYYAGFYSADDPGTAVIARMRDLSFSDAAIERIAEGLPLWHCNDLEYDPERRRIYAATGEKRVGIVDPETMTVEGYHELAVYCWAVSRYPDGGWFVFDGDAGWRFEKDFSGMQVISQHNTEKIRAALDVPEGIGCWQGSVVMDGRPWMIWTEAGDRPGYYKAFSLYPVFGGEEIWRCETIYETEGACMVGGQMRFVYGNIRIGGAEWERSEMMTKTVCAEFSVIDLEKDKDKGLYIDVPEGYELVGATAQIRLSSGSVRALPLFSGDGRCRVRIQKAQKNKVTIRAEAEYTGVGFLIAGICRKKEGNG